MATMTMDASFSLCLAVLVCIAIIPSSTYLAGAQEKAGVNYGLLGDNLPTPQATVAKFKELGVERIRLFDPNPDALAALHGANISVVLGTLNADIHQLATDPNFAAQWVQTHVIPHAASVTFRYISVGNEVIPGDMANDVLPAMKNLQNALNAAGVQVPVSTVVAMTTLGTSYPPSAGAFSSDVLPIMAPIATFLAANNAPLLLNVYPYFPYLGAPTDVPLFFALGNGTSPAYQDGPLSYFTLFDAMVDATFAALDKAGAPGVSIVITETGWPSGGGAGLAETAQNAQTYNNIISANVRKGKGTPKRPGKALETYVFAFFNENQKPAGTEQHFGLFNPDLTPVYRFTF